MNSLEIYGFPESPKFIDALSYRCDSLVKLMDSSIEAANSIITGFKGHGKSHGSKFRCVEEFARMHMHMFDSIRADARQPARFMRRHDIGSCTVGEILDITRKQCANVFHDTGTRRGSKELWSIDGKNVVSDYFYVDFPVATYSHVANENKSKYDNPYTVRLGMIDLIGADWNNFFEGFVVPAWHRTTNMCYITVEKCDSRDIPVGTGYYREISLVAAVDRVVRFLTLPVNPASDSLIRAALSNILRMDRDAPGQDFGGKVIDAEYETADGKWETCGCSLDIAFMALTCPGLTIGYDTEKKLAYASLGDAAAGYGTVYARTLFDNTSVGDLIDLWMSVNGRKFDMKVDNETLAAAKTFCFAETCIWRVDGQYLARALRIDPMNLISKDIGCELANTFIREGPMSELFQNIVALSNAT